MLKLHFNAELITNIILNISEKKTLPSITSRDIFIFQIFYSIIPIIMLDRNNKVTNTYSILDINHYFQTPQMIVRSISFSNSKY